MADKYLCLIDVNINIRSKKAKWKIKGFSIEISKRPYEDIRL